MRKLAGMLSSSPLFSKAKELFDANAKDWDLPMSRLTKLYVGSYLIMRDYAAGNFPPRFDDQAETYAAELNYHCALPGVSEEESRRRDMCKPFGSRFDTRAYLDHMMTLLETLDGLEVPSGGKVLELGSGEGWMVEILAISGYEVCGTSISQGDIELAAKRVEALRAKDLRAELEFRVAPMESVHEHVDDRIPFDAVFVYEALHHAFSWETTFASVYRCLDPGGWFLICNEPNVLHTLVSYRVGTLSNTHELGLSRRKMTRALRDVGFRETRILKNRINNGINQHWIAARK